MSKSLIIVESPAKARTISKYLGRGYAVMASVGHVKDLPENKLGVDIQRNFTPQYVTIKGKTQDRKSTRLNSSHLVISYAVFCLKKKNKKQLHKTKKSNKFTKKVRSNRPKKNPKTI